MLNCVPHLISQRPSLFLFLSLKAIDSVTLGQSFTAVTNSAGEVFTFGNGNSKCLGHGDTKNSFQPKCVEALQGRPIARLRAGHSHVVAFEQ
jgi:alpha-tubulin suppressor-like RCC1 family protein